MCRNVQTGTGIALLKYMTVIFKIKKNYIFQYRTNIFRFLGSTSAVTWHVRQPADGDSEDYVKNVLFYYKRKLFLPHNGINDQQENKL